MHGYLRINTRSPTANWETRPTRAQPRMRTSDGKRTNRACNLNRVTWRNAPRETSLRFWRVLRPGGDPQMTSALGGGGDTPKAAKNRDKLRVFYTDKRGGVPQIRRFQTLFKHGPQQRKWSSLLAPESRENWRVS